MLAIGGSSGLQGQEKVGARSWGGLAWFKSAAEMHMRKIKRKRLALEFRLH
jgi:hypothetical protein